MAKGNIKGIDTTITKDKLKNHWQYHSWMYIIMVFVMVLAWNLIYSVTEYRPPRDKKLELYLLSYNYDSDKLDQLAEMYSDKYVGNPEYAGENGELEEVNFLVLNYGASDDAYGPELLMTRLASLEGDLYMVNEDTLTSFIAQELIIPIDTYVESGLLSIDEDYVEVVTRNEVVGDDDDGNPVYGNNRYIYAVPANNMYGLLDGGYVDNRNMYLVIMSYSEKPDVAADLIAEMQDDFIMDKPEWLVERENQQRQEISELPSGLSSGN